jgi:basic membrane lipoprotein Med (substrate-binding protein (PBP1-ABC) superfamily)
MGMSWSGFYVLEKKIGRELYLDFFHHCTRRDRSAKLLRRLKPDSRHLALYHGFFYMKKIQNVFANYPKMA